MCGFIHTLPTLWGCAFRRLRRLLRTNAYAAMHKMACFESAAIVSECEKMTQGGRTVCYWYTKYPPGSLSASTVGGRRVCSQLPSHSVCGHSTIVAWCVRVIQQSSSSSLQTVTLLLIEPYANESSQICPFLALRPQFESVHHQNRRLSSHSYSRESVIFVYFLD